MVNGSLNREGLRSGQEGQRDITPPDRLRLCFPLFLLSAASSGGVWTRYVWSGGGWLMAFLATRCKLLSFSHDSWEMWKRSTFYFNPPHFTVFLTPHSSRVATNTDVVLERCLRPLKIKIKIKNHRCRKKLKRGNSVCKKALYSICLRQSNCSHSFLSQRVWELVWIDFISNESTIDQRVYCLINQ